MSVTRNFLGSTPRFTRRVIIPSGLRGYSRGSAGSWSLNAVMTAGVSMRGSQREEAAPVKSKQAISREWWDARPAHKGQLMTLFSLYPAKEFTRKEDFFFFFDSSN